MKPAAGKIPLAKPCSENREAMLSRTNGRHCPPCERTVVDFSDKTNTGILGYLATNLNTCGRVYRDQVPPHDMPKTGFQKWKSYVAAASFFLGTLSGAINPAFGQAALASSNAVNSQKAKSNEKPYIQADGNLHLKGIVIDPATDKPIPGVTVSVKSMLKRPFEETRYQNFEKPFYDPLFTTETDANGKFELAIPAVEMSSLPVGIYFEQKEYNSNNIWLRQIENREAITQYLFKRETEPIGIEKDYREVFGCRFPQEYHFITDSRKMYRTRTGLVLDYIFTPFRKVKNRIMTAFRNENNY